MKFSGIIIFLKILLRPLAILFDRTLMLRFTRRKVFMEVAPSKVSAFRTFLVHLTHANAYVVFLARHVTGQEVF